MHVNILGTRCNMASAAGHRQVGGASIQPVEGRRPRASRVDHGGFVACGHGQIKVFRGEARA